MKYRVFALDVDGVLTDGGIYLDAEGKELLRFHVLDGLGIRRWIEAGLTCVWISARSSPVVVARAQMLGVDHLLLGVDDKARALRNFLSEHGYSWSDVVYLGDDIVDLEPVRLSGLGVAVQTAVDELKEVADLVTLAPGGGGAVREVVERILPKPQGRR